MRACKSAFKLSGVLLALALFSVLLLPSTASAQPVTLISVEAATTDENDTFVDVRVRLSRAVDTDTAVKFATSNDTAKAGQDFYGTYQIVIIPAGETSKTVRIWNVNDRVAENDEQYNVRIFGLRTQSNVVMGATHAKVTIRDDDSVAGPDAKVSVFGTTINEGGRFVDVRIVLDRAVDTHVSVKFATSSSSARAGSDFFGTFQTIHFSPGETSKVGRVWLIDDRVAEPTEHFKVRIWDAKNAIVGSAAASVQINDND